MGGEAHGGLFLGSEVEVVVVVVVVVMDDGVSARVFRDLSHFG